MRIYDILTILSKSGQNDKNGADLIMPFVDFCYFLLSSKYVLIMNMENILQNMIFLCYGQSKTEWACGRELEVIFIDFGGATLPVLSKLEFTLWFTIQRSHRKFANRSPFEVAILPSQCIILPNPLNLHKRCQGLKLRFKL